MKQTKFHISCHNIPQRPTDLHCVSANFMYMYIPKASQLISVNEEMSNIIVAFACTLDTITHVLLLFHILDAKQLQSKNIDLRFWQAKIRTYKCSFTKIQGWYYLLWKITWICKLWDRFQDFVISVAIWKLLNDPWLFVRRMLSNNFTKALEQVLYIAPKTTSILVCKHFSRSGRNLDRDHSNFILSLNYVLFQYTPVCSPILSNHTIILSGL